MAPPPQKNKYKNVIKGNQLMDSLNLDKYIDKKMPFLNVHKKSKKYRKKKSKKYRQKKRKKYWQKKSKKNKEIYQKKETNTKVN